MNGHPFTLNGATLIALPTGALWWQARRLLCVSDLHLGKSDRAARRWGMLLPPYETADTLARLDADIAATRPEIVVCLGDSFDDRQAADALCEEHLSWFARLMAGRRWLWIEGNHDPGPLTLGGSYLTEFRDGPLAFRHIAQSVASGEVSGHYHPKARVAGVTRPCFLVDANRVILPAYGTFTGGLHATAAPLAGLMRKEARALLLGPRITTVPIPRAQDRSNPSTAVR